MALRGDSHEVKISPWAAYFQRTFGVLSAYRTFGQLNELREFSGRVTTRELGFGFELAHKPVDTPLPRFLSQGWRFSQENSRLSHYNSTL